MPDPLVKLEGVSKAFGDRELFKNVDLEVSMGEIVTIVGPSGVGKTTLLRAIAGMTDVEGQVTIGGQPAQHNGVTNGNHRLCLVTQHANLWDHLSALDNVALVRRLLHDEPRRTARRAAMRYMEALEVGGVARQYPHSLSGGEQQRVSLARGFAAETPLLLLDEVSSNVDFRRRRMIADALLDIAKSGRSIVLVTHDLETAQLLRGRTLRLTPDGLDDLSEVDTRVTS